MKSQYVDRQEEIISDDGFMKRVKETVTVRLRACPFCGGRGQSSTALNEDNEEKRVVKCSKCRAQGPMYDELERAVEAWNRRG